MGFLETKSVTQVGVTLGGNFRYCTHPNRAIPAAKHHGNGLKCVWTCALLL